jgi:predicted nucleotidyltransferase
MLMDAQDLLGRKVDIVTIQALHPLMRERVLRESVQI